MSKRPKLFIDDYLKKEKKRRGDRTFSPASISSNELFRIVSDNEEALSTIDDVIKLFPDIELAVEIITSLVTTGINPTSSKLTYTIDGILLPPELKVQIKDLIVNYAKDNYSIEDKLSDIVRDVLFDTGSYVQILLEEDNLSKIIRGMDSRSSTTLGTLESLLDDSKSSLQIGNDYKFANIKITDKPSKLFKDDLARLLIKKRVENRLFDRVEGTLEDVKMDNNVLIFSTEEKGSRLYIKRVKSQYVVPVVSESDPSLHYGYFIFIKDRTKTEIQSSSLTSYLKMGINGQDRMSSILSNVEKTLYNYTKDVPKLTGIDELKKYLLEQTLEKFIKDSSYGILPDATLDISDSMLDVIVTSILSDTGLDVVFLPEEMVSYIAINYKKNGIGKSLLERLTILASLRAILLFVSLMSFLKSSITTTEVNVELDQDDPMAESTMESIKAFVFQNRKVKFPIGMLKLNDITDWLQRVGYSFNFKHPALPDVNIDIEEKPYEMNPVNTDLKETIDKLTVMSLYLTPETIDNSYSPDFATTVLINNSLLAERIRKMKDKFNVAFTIDIKKKMKLDGILRNKVAKVIKNNIETLREFIDKELPEDRKELLSKMSDDEIAIVVYREIIRSIKVALPSDRVINKDDIESRVSSFIDNVNNLLDNFITQDNIPSEVMGELGDNAVDIIKSGIKTVMIFKFLAENDLFPELFKSFVKDETGKPIYNFMEDYLNFIDGLKDNYQVFLEKINKNSSESISINEE